MIPLIGCANEFTHQANLVKNVVEEVKRENRYQSFEINVGAMIEVPRAALTADEIAAAGAKFFSYGTHFHIINFLPLNILQFRN